MSFYIVPMTGANSGPADRRRPKYIAELAVNWAMIDIDDTAIVWANASPAQDAAMALNADALVVPPLDTVINPASVQAALEAHDIPGQWVAAGMTYRQVLRICIGIAQLTQRLAGMGSRLALSGQLDTTCGSLSVGARQALSSAADAFALDRSAIVGGTTLRQAMQVLGAQMAGSRAFVLGDL